MDWWPAALFLAIVVILSFIWSRSFKGQFQVGWDVLPDEPWWRRVLRIGAGPTLGALTAAGIWWIVSGDVPVVWFIAIAIAAAIAAVAVTVTGRRGVERQA